MGESAETHRARLNNETQIAMNRENIEAQRQENAIDRQFQHNEWLSQFQKQVEQVQKQWEQEGERWYEQQDYIHKYNDEMNKYNSPESQIARLAAAGISPAAVYGDIASGMAAAPNVVGQNTSHSSSPNPSGNSGGHGVSGHLLTPSPFSTDAALFSSVAQLNDSLAKTAEVGLHADKQQNLLKHEVENIVADTASKREQTHQTYLQNLLTEAFGDKRQREEINKIISEAEKAKAEGNNQLALEKYNIAMEKCASQDYKLKEESRPIVIQNLKEETERIKSEQQRNKAQTREANTRADVNIEERKYKQFENQIKEIETQREKNPEVVKQRLNTLLADLQKEESVKRDETLKAEIQFWRDSANDPRYKDYPRQWTDLALDWLRQKLGLGVSANVNIK